MNDRMLLSNVIASQEIHKYYGGIVPELASRAHQQNIIPVVELAICQAGISKKDINAVAYTRGPGLMGSLLVGTSFAKGFSIAMQIPLIEVNHLHAHILSHFITEQGTEVKSPSFPFLCLLVSGGHTLLALVSSYFEMKIIGKTIDDASGEAFDKCGKIMGLAYPAGPLIDNLAQKGNSLAFRFNKPVVQGLDFSFSGLKTSFLYFIRDRLKDDPEFISNNLSDLCASIQKTIVEILTGRVKKAVKETGITEIAIAGGVAANSELQATLRSEAELNNWNLYIPPLKFTTDNAAMIAINGYYKFLDSRFAGQDEAPFARMVF
jgi:N6-L-threonylcarbamoyladenine synthase